ncbi:MAG TPA: hypothetical protein P5550_01215 [Bacteroidales bacterium]|nr:hypothetical protein [Bacteroidales bacterium]HRZ76248.1 hypothetical protein [Bacteroidales bacterium]
MGKIIRRILLGLFIVLVLAVAGGYLYITRALPSAGETPTLSVDATPGHIERGRYLAHHVYACMSCHSDQQHQLFAHPTDPSGFGKGGRVWDEKDGLPGKVVAPNLTPFHLGEWTDGEIFHAITAGISRDGRALFPLMPYPAYGKADKEDILDIIAYLRSLPPIPNEVPLTELSFPMSLIVNMIPKQPAFSQRPDPSDKVAFGGYLAAVASCNDCHTPMVKGRYDETRRFAGGNPFPLGHGDVVRSANLTPHESGLKHWTEASFIAAFRKYSDSAYVHPEIAPGEFNTVMPWNEYSAMSDAELSALWAYLQTLPPVENPVQKFSAGGGQ